MMRSTLLTAVALVALAFPAAAQRGGEGNHTACNGRGNDNSRCEGRPRSPGHGRPHVTNNGGAGGSAQATAAAAARARATGGSATVIQNGGGHTGTPIAMGMSLPPQCGVAFSGGGSNHQGAGLLGFSFETESCRKHRLAMALFQMGHRDAARELLCTMQEIRDAFSLSGIPCSADRPRTVFHDGGEAPARPAYCSIPGIMNRECN